MTDTPASRRDRTPTRLRVPVCGIFLVGFMGAGKTSVGRLLADQLGWEFVDLDAVIEAREGLSVPQIFREHGERGFREREHVALRGVLAELNRNTAAVIALGGGAFVQPENFELLAAPERPSVFLDTPVEELWQRCSIPGEPERPLRTDPVEFRALYEKRRVHYLRSVVRVETAGKSVRDIAHEVIESLGLQEKVTNKETPE
jgi:shikimate kinase